VELKSVLDLICNADIVNWCLGYLTIWVEICFQWNSCLCVCVFCVYLYLWENGRIGKHVFGLSMLLIG